LISSEEEWDEIKSIYEDCTGFEEEEEQEIKLFKM
jgi:hypothetical protein